MPTQTQWCHQSHEAWMNQFGTLFSSSETKCSLKYCNIICYYLFLHEHLAVGVGRSIRRRRAATRWCFGPTGETPQGFDGPTDQIRVVLSLPGGVRYNEGGPRRAVPWQQDELNTSVTHYCCSMLIFTRNQPRTKCFPQFFFGFSPVATAGIIPKCSLFSSFTHKKQQKHNLHSLSCFLFSSYTSMCYDLSPWRT